MTPVEPPKGEWPRPAEVPPPEAVPRAAAPSTARGAPGSQVTRHALTVDLEDWHQLFRRHVTGVTSEASRNVVVDTQLVLDLFAEFDIHATFFVVGRVATAFPGLIRQVAAAGHEIGCHTYEHELLYAVKPADLQADIERTREQLQVLSGQPVVSFRAPAFSVGSLSNDGYFEALAAAGIERDSSVYPVSGLRYGIREAPRHPFVVHMASGPVHEFPLATWKLRGHRLPVAGGTCFRFLPALLLERAMADLDAEGEPSTFYLHPYEFHRGLLHLTGLSWHDRLQTAYARHMVLHNLSGGPLHDRWVSLLSSHHFVSMGELQ